MASSALNLAPSQSSGGSSAPGANAFKVKQTSLPAPKASLTHMQLLAHAIARLPDPVRSASSKNLFLP